MQRMDGVDESSGDRATEIERDTPPDRIEVWGRRVGKTLGWAFVVFLLIQLIRTYAG